MKQQIPPLRCGMTNEGNCGRTNKGNCGRTNKKADGAARSGGTLSAGVVEVDGDDGGDVDRAAVQHVGPVAPATDGVDGCATQQTVAAEDVCGRNRAIL